MSSTSAKILTFNHFENDAGNHRESQKKKHPDNQTNNLVIITHGSQQEKSIIGTDLLGHKGGQGVPQSDLCSARRLHGCVHGTRSEDHG